MEYNEVLTNAKSILNRAKRLLASDEIDIFDIYTLANMMNEYVDFLEIFKYLNKEKKYIKKERQLSNDLVSFCDRLEYPELVKFKTYQRSKTNI